MNILTRTREKLGLLSNKEVSETTSQLTTAVRVALFEAISKSDGGPVVVVNNLTVNIQINAAQGGGATVHVRS